MRQNLTRLEWQQLSEKGQDQVLWWLCHKEYRSLNLGTCIELLKDASYNLHKEDSDGRFFNNIMINNESVFGWDGTEPIAIIWYEIVECIRQLLSNGRTLEEKLS